MVSASASSTISDIQKAFLSKAEELMANGKLSDVECVELLSQWKERF
jgi:hypothetical protein